MNRPESIDPANRLRTLLDLACVLLLGSAVISIDAAAPATTLDYAQTYQIDCVLDAAHGGNWLLPRSHARGLDRKPPLYVWLDAAVVMLTGQYDDFTFRLPTVAAVLLTAMMVYSLGRRWHGRRAGLIAAGLWLTALHMGKGAYMALTDMLLTCAVTAAFCCADRLIFHRRAGAARPSWLWAAGFWIAMLLGALAKGWGLLNLTSVGGGLLLAIGLRSGLRIPRQTSWARRWRTRLRLVARRWKRGLRPLRLWFGLIVVAILAAMLGLMLIFGGAGFRRVVNIEIAQRFTGIGKSSHTPWPVPPILQLLYYQLPASLLAILALALVSPRKWWRGSGPILLPLCWILAVVAPFSVSRNFRPDYLLPCYPAVALLAAWAIDRLARSAAEEQAALSRWRWAAAAVGVAVSLALIVLPAAFLLQSRLPAKLLHTVRLPSEVPALTRWILFALPAAGALAIIATLAAARAWNIRGLAIVLIVVMAGVLFIDRNLVSRHAVTGDGDTLKQFAREAKPLLADEPYVLCIRRRIKDETPDETSVPLYLGRWGDRPETGAETAALVNGCPDRWLIISEKGLAEAGAARPNANGGYRIKGKKEHYAFDVFPADFGTVRLTSARPIETDDLGRIYLIELARPAHVRGQPVNVETLQRPPPESDGE